MKLFEDHAFLLFLAVLAVLLCYTIITITTDKPVDEKIIGVGFVALVGALAGRADARK